ncbi:endopeptidase (plasmid) [Bacillus paramycoides]|uniref:glycoside hydrolase family 19 protein n=1 Tax=Bacillus paramycoides TaxID=2026194 RepID=UPI003183087A
MPTAARTHITVEQLEEFGWNMVNDLMVRDLNTTLEKYNITTRERIRHFLSQCMIESDYGKATKEYADGTEYEFRIDLGNVNPGDGPKYKGAGYIQLTGRYNYLKLAEEIGDPRIMEGVDYVAKNYPWFSAGFWWEMNNMNDLIDSGANVREVTLRVNGRGLRQLEEREKYYQRTNAILV